MAEIRVVFLHGLGKDLTGLVQSLTPPRFELHPVAGQSPVAEQMAAVREADFLLLYRAELPDPVLESATRLRMIQLLAAGYDQLNLGLIGRLGIPCATNSGVNSWAVADHAVLLMLALYHRLLQADRSTRQGSWRKPITGLNTYEMDGKMVGILGIGNIGLKVARRVRAFGASVQYHDMYPLTAEREKEENLVGVSPGQLFRTSDIVTCHTPLTPATRHLVGRQQLSLMKPTALLINTSRGGVVDEAALIEALRGGKIGGAGLDVFETEPVEESNPLLEMEQVVLTPHSAGTTRDTWCRRLEFAYRNMERVWAGESPLAWIPETRVRPEAEPCAEEEEG